jgi:Recombinase
MPHLLKLRQAVRLIGVSPGRLYRAIADGRLTAAPGGGPGKPTLVSLEAVQTFCRSEGLRVPDEAEISERSERLERSGRSERAERSEHAERSTTPDDHTLGLQTLETITGQYLAQIMARQSDYIETFVRQELSHLVERVVEQVVERLAERFTTSAPTPIHLERSERPERAERSIPAITDNKAAVLIRLRAMQAEGLSLQAMARRLNNEGVPTLSGKGHWQKGTISKLLAQV